MLSRGDLCLADMMLGVGDDAGVNNSHILS